MDESIFKNISTVGVNMYQYEENLLRANSSVAVAELPSSFLQLPPSLRLLSTTCCLGQIRVQPIISTAQYLEMLTLSFQCLDAWKQSVPSTSGEWGLRVVCWTEGAPRHSPSPLWWLQSRAAYRGVVGVLGFLSEVWPLIGDGWASCQKCCGVWPLQSGKFGSAPARFCRV